MAMASGDTDREQSDKTEPQSNLPILDQRHAIVFRLRIVVVIEAFRPRDLGFEHAKLSKSLKL